MLKNQIDLEGTIIHDWRHYYSPEELQEKKEDSISLRNQLDRLEEEKKAFMDEHRNVTKLLKSQEKMARMEIKAGYEDKSERVKPTMNYAKETVEFWSISTGDMVDERNMTRAEKKQGSFVYN